jgi:hypothetical protein
VRVSDIRWHAPLTPSRRSRARVSLRARRRSTDTYEVKASSAEGPLSGAESGPRVGFEAHTPLAYAGMPELQGAGSWGARSTSFTAAENLCALTEY